MHSVTWLFALVLLTVVSISPGRAQKGMLLPDGELGARLGCAINALGPRNPGCMEYPYGVPAPLNPGEGVYGPPGELPPEADLLPVMPHMGPGEGVMDYSPLPAEADPLFIPDTPVFLDPAPDPAPVPIDVGTAPYQNPYDPMCRPPGTSSDRPITGGCAPIPEDIASDQPEKPAYRFKEGKLPGQPCPHTGSSKTCEEILREGGGGSFGYTLGGGVAR